MRTRLFCLVLAVLLLPALSPAQDSRALRAPGPGGLASRQGGDHPADAVLIPALPFTDTGSTTGMADDFAWPCPYGNSGVAPDVFYRFDPATDMTIRIDLCGSLYDTCVYLLDADTGEMLACNDDYYLDEECGIYVSCIEAVGLEVGRRYWIAVDGYPNHHGEYLLNVWTLSTAVESMSWSAVKSRY